MLNDIKELEISSKSKINFLEKRMKEELSFHHNHNDCLVESPPIPKTMLLDLCNGCNHKCIFCMSRLMDRKVSRMKHSLFTKIIDQAMDLGVEELGLYATGEPFMHKKLEDFVKEAKDKGFRYVYISTNGALIDERRLKKVIDSGLDSIKFSVNAGSRDAYYKVHGKDDWKKVIKNIKFVSKYRKKSKKKMLISVSYIVTNISKNQKKDIENLLSPFVDEIMFWDCGTQQGFMLANQGVLIDKKESKIDFCNLPFNRLHVTSEGFLTLCCTDYENYLTVADLNETNLINAWNNQLFISMRKRHLSGDLKGALCYNCMNNTDNEMFPIDSDLSNQIDVKSFYLESRDNLRIELENRDNNK